MRYMPTLRFPVVGSRVITQGSVMKRPPSFGQHLRMGKSSNEKLSRLITSLHGPVATVLGKNLPISASIGSIFTLSRKPCGDFTSMKPRIDRKSTRLNSSHLGISYAVFCLKKKNKEE